MFTRVAISLTILLSPGAVSAGPQAQTPAATANSPEAAAPQTASGAGQTSQEPVANPAVTDVKHIPKAGIETLIRTGNEHMRNGDILGARQFYLQATASGDAAAALAMGRSFDPIYFEKLVKGNAGPNPSRALKWYERAKNAGAVQTASIRIEELRRFMSK